VKQLLYRDDVNPHNPDAEGQTPLPGAAKTGQRGVNILYHINGKMPPPAFAGDPVLRRQPLRHRLQSRKAGDTIIGGL